MNKKEAEDILKNTFNQSFDETRFIEFISNFLNDLNFDKATNWYAGNRIFHNFKDHIVKYKRIAKYTDPLGEYLDVLIVEVRSTSKLERARTALRNFVIRHLKQFEKDHALVAFYSAEDNSDWRFSYIRIEETEEFNEKGKIRLKSDFTPAKRYSFRVGKNEGGYTAKQQLLPLLKDLNNYTTVNQIEAAFSVERVTNEFFKQYKELFSRIVSFLNNDISTKKILEQEGINPVRFTKKLLGQIVFLYFLQKKGWLGVSKKNKWGQGEKDFLKKLYNNAESEEVNFFKEKLQLLFYEALAKERENDWYSKFNCKIPFLNGGLFEAEYDWKLIDIYIPNGLFWDNKTNEQTGDIGTGIFNVFNRYNFTIQEDEPLDKEVAVDPEMLGKVFENMLEISDRKDKGAFYTPREIVHYMCQESLIHYLNNSLNSIEQSKGQGDLFNTSKTKATKPKTPIYKDDIEVFIRKGMLYTNNDLWVSKQEKETSNYSYKLPKSIQGNADLIDEYLTNIRVCDPAIGSGAFPLGILHELLSAQIVLMPFLSKQYLKRKYKEINLPTKTENYNERINYYLKRHIIQKSIYGVDIEDSAIDIARLRLWLSLVVDEEDVEHIETLPNLDYKIVKGNSLIGLPETMIRDIKKEDEIEKLKIKFYNEKNEEKKKQQRKEINKNIGKFLSSAKQYLGNSIDFDFKLYFSQVWKEKGGFDIVIGNPPYINLQNIDETYRKNLAAQKYKSMAGRGDIYCLFYEQGIKLLKDQGILTYITSNSWIKAKYGKKLRKLFVDEGNPLEIINFEDTQLFKSAIVETNILLLQKGRWLNELKGLNISPKTELNKKNVNLAVLMEDQGVDVLFEKKSDQEWLILDKESLEIKNQIDKNSTLIKNNKNIDIIRGIITGYNKAYLLEFGTPPLNRMLSSSKDAPLLKKVLRGRDIQRYNYNYSDYYIIVVKKAAAEDIIKNRPEIYRHLLENEEALKQRGQVRNGQHHWLELDNSPKEEYLALFEGPKIIWGELSDKPKFTYDDEKYYAEATLFMMTGKDLKFLLAILNSKLSKWYFNIVSSTSGMGTNRWKKYKIQQFPIKKTDDITKQKIENIVDCVLWLRKSEKDYPNSKISLMYFFFEDLLDGMIFDLYFEEKLKYHKKPIISLLPQIPDISKIKGIEKLKEIENTYLELSNRNNKVNNNLFFLDSIPEIRIILGK